MDIDLLSTYSPISMIDLVLDETDDCDRPQNNGLNSGTCKLRNGLGKKEGKSIPKVGVGRAEAKRSTFQTGATGPQAFVQDEFNLQGAGAMAQSGTGNANRSDVRLTCKAFVKGNANIKYHCNVNGILDCIDYIDRPGCAYTKGLYANAGTYASAFTDKPGQRIPKAGVIAEAGVGRARAEWSVFEAEAKGPNASAAAQANVLGVGAMARAEVGSASASAGPLRVKAGLGVDTGVKLGLDGIECKLLGTGFEIGKSTGVSLIGNEVACVVM